MNELFIIGGFLLLGTLIYYFGNHRIRNDKRSLLTLIVVLLLGGLIGLLVFWLERKDLLTLNAGYLMTEGLALTLGAFFPWFLYAKLSWAKREELIRDRDSFWPEAIFTLLTALLLGAGVTLVLYYLLGDLALVFWTSGFIFLAPLLLLKSFDLMRQVPLKDYRVKWSFSPRLIHENDWNWTNEMWVSFEVRESWNKPGSHRKARFRILAPRDVPLGEIFRLAVREYNKQARNIVVQDLGFEPDNREMFWWLFSLKFVWNRPHTWFPNLRFLDPNDSALVNALRPGDLVKVTRISTGKEPATEQIAIGQPIP